jgi:acyl carrier protein
MGRLENCMGEDVLLNEVAGLIVEALHLEDLSPADIDPEAPLFGKGLGLDSIDALELALAVSQRYGVTLSSEDPAIREVFASLRSLTDHIRAHRGA